MPNNLLHILSASMIILLSSCAVKREIPAAPVPKSNLTGQVTKHDHSEFAKIPDRPTSLAYRLVLQTIPYTRERAFWGQWGGCGSRGGAPVDEMDEIFWKHDVVYAETRSIRTMRLADEACVAALAKLDTTSMSDEALEFHKRSTKFFTSRLSTVVGKPVSCFVYFNEPEQSPFSSPESVYEFFEPEESNLTKSSSRQILASLKNKDSEEMSSARSAPRRKNEEELSLANRN
jgi:hypothetical protein